MGMFDEITIKKALPLPKELKKLPIKWSEHKFQTKDLDNCMFEYFIDKKGSLHQIEIENEYVEYTEEEKKSKDYRAWDIYKDVVEISRRNKWINFHGILRFYDYINIDEQNDCWVEFGAYFVYGKLDKVELKEFRIEPSQTIKLAEFKKELEFKQKSFKSKLVSGLKKVKGDKVLYYLAKLCYKISHFFSSLQWKIYKFIGN